jgi:hypothetical protein
MATERQTIPKIPFGQYKGQSLAVLIRDPDYVEWLLRQEWLAQKHPDLYKIIQHNFRSDGSFRQNKPKPTPAKKRQTKILPRRPLPKSPPPAPFTVEADNDYDAMEEIEDILASLPADENSYYRKATVAELTNQLRQLPNDVKLMLAEQLRGLLSLPSQADLDQLIEQAYSTGSLGSTLLDIVKSGRLPRPRMVLTRPGSDGIYVGRRVRVKVADVDQPHVGQIVKLLDDDQIEIKIFGSASYVVGSRHDPDLELL